MEGCHADGMWLDLGDLVRRESAYSDDPVFGPPTVKLFQSRHFVRAAGDDDLPRPVNGKILGLAELSHPSLAGDTQACLERARLVVQARVENTAVVSGLVVSDDAFLLEDGNPNPWESFG
jgi:hypothetical protein